jgi:hypothetical protein
MVDMNKLSTYNTVLLMNPRHGSRSKFHYIMIDYDEDYSGNTSCTLN